MAITINKTGIIAICRKFYPSDDNERKSIILAKNCYDGELGKPRIFELNGVRYFPSSVMMSMVRGMRNI